VPSQVLAAPSGEGVRTLAACFMTVRNTGCSYFDFFFTGYATCPRYWEQARGTPVNEHIVIDGENKLKASEECFQQNGLLR